MEYISKQSLLADLNEATPRSYFAFDTMVREYPTEDVVPVVHAHWLKINNPNYSPFDQSSEYYLFCSNCECGHVQMYDFCPTCGAKMDEEVDNA